MAIKISAILTCFNRRDKTLRCIRSLFRAEQLYNQTHKDAEVCTSVYLTDDACTDGTADAVREVCKGRDLHILQGNGQCYWASGMRLAWGEAMKAHETWDFYLLLNDDTIIGDNAFDELFKAHQYALSNTGKPGIYSGMVSDIYDISKITYSGSVFDDASRSQYHKVMPQGKPLKVDITNANILLVPKEIVGNVGIFYKGFIHGGADYDYALTVARHGYAAFITENVCGQCEFDHKDGGEVIKDFRRMSLLQRYRYVNNPVHCDHDYLLVLKRNIPHKYPVSWMLRKIRVFAPSVYAMICRMRGLEDY